MIMNVKNAIMVNIQGKIRNAVIQEIVLNLKKGYAINVKIIIIQDQIINVLMQNIVFILMIILVVLNARKNYIMIKILKNAKRPKEFLKIVNTGMTINIVKNVKMDFI